MCVSHLCIAVTKCRRTSLKGRESSWLIAPVHGWWVPLFLELGQSSNNMIEKPGGSCRPPHGSQEWEGGKAIRCSFQWQSNLSPVALHRTHQAMAVPFTNTLYLCFREKQALIVFFFCPVRSCYQDSMPAWQNELQCFKHFGVGVRVAARRQETTELCLIKAHSLLCSSFPPWELLKGQTKDRNYTSE